MSQLLQGSTVKIAQAYEMVSVVAAPLNDIRDDAASEFQNIFTKCQAMAASADTIITVPRTYLDRLCKTMLNTRMQNNIIVALYSFLD